MSCWKTSPILLLTVVGLLLGCASAKHRHNSADDTPGNFDYYLLTLSWAPEFCSTHGSNESSSECDPQRHFGFVVHGLWPENEDGSYPQHCAPAQPVAQATVQHMLPIIPDRGLIQHEWATHGTCSGLDTQTYFADVEKAFRQVQIPQEYRAPTQTINANPADIEQKFADANHAPRERISRFLQQRGVCRRRSLPDQRPAISPVRIEPARLPRAPGHGATNAVAISVAAYVRSRVRLLGMCRAGRDTPRPEPLESNSAQA